ncbi:Fungal transcriptional regulatory protein, N-terminal [Penicillium camemberti]|uniref:Fungal transcriptional regulatory protein, N-terminal n=1 Tax=Penicillium camemberti (strain FM 013) TaxID=1429867 RepID=A0A0G4NVU9_PENC3|nr:Fungal transcriptional regulatory protein, N-terminal [Penicillium camemberti]
MDHEDSSKDLRRTRRVNACIICRDRKVRCSGTFPCTTCVRRSTVCTFGPDDRKVTVSERFLNDLKRKAREDPSEQSPDRRRRPESSPDLQSRTSNVGDTGAPSCGSGQETITAITAATVEQNDPVIAPSSHGDLCDSEGPETSISNPLDSGRSRFCVDNNGRRRFLGPSSTWAYTRQVIVDIQQHFNEPSIPEIPLHVDGNAYMFDWSDAGDIPFTKAELPSLDYAIYLMNTVQFHIAQLYHLFDQKSFMDGLYQFYDCTVPEPPKSKLWYIQYLLVISFGKSFLMQKTAKEPPSGVIFFARAMKLLPNIQGLYDDPLLSMEILCAASLYLQCLDHRNNAYVYLGIAFRMALTQGLHREVDLEASAEESDTRYRSIWWTLYILDRRFSSLMGTPISINDADVTMGLPNSGISHHRCRTLAMHVRLSRIISNVLDYGRLNQSFIKSVQEVLRSLAALAPDLEHQFKLNGSSGEPISRATGTLHLCYHQCVILATRPLLVHILFQRLSTSSNNHTFTDPIIALTRKCFEAAHKSLQILSALRSQGLLDWFLPFDIDCTHSSAFVLLLIKSICPFPEISGYDMPQIDRSKEVLDSMIERGSVPAQYRQSELDIFQQLLRLFGDQDDQNPALAEQVTVHDDAHHNESFGETSSFSQFVDAVGDAGLSPSEMLEIARLLDWGDVFRDPIMSLPFEQP